MKSIIKRSLIGLLSLSFVFLFLASFKLTAHAQETPTPTIAVDPIIESLSPTITPIEATATPAPTDIPSVTPTDVVTLTPTPIVDLNVTLGISPTAEPTAVVTATGTPEPTSPTSLTPSAAPQLTTDKADYHPGETATITGSFFQSLQDLVLKIFGGSTDDGTYKEDSFNVSTDEQGSFSFLYALDNIFRPLYTVQTFDASGTQLAQTTFTDSGVGAYDQCSNDDGDGYATGDMGCRWTNGNLQSNNSTYFEHDATVQRTWLTGFVPGSTHTVTFKYGTTKGGKHAYDFLTEWDHSESWITLDDRCQDITGCTTASPETTLPIPSDPNAALYETADRVFTMRGGTMNSASTPIIASGVYSGDSETVVTVNFTVANSGAMCATKQGTTTCDVAIWFGAHISSQADWGTGNSAVNISGSPYHVALAAVDSEDQTQGGGRDNQMQSAAVLPSATITIIKNTVPDAAQDFGYTTTGGLTPSTFNLDDDADGTLSNTQTYTGLAAGSYSVTEGANSAYGVGISCTDLSGGTTTDNSTRTASIGLAAGETVTCTFTNTLLTGTLNVIKHVVNDNGGTKTASDFNLHVKSGINDVIGSPAVGAESPGTSYTLNAGTYAVSEDAPPAGYSNITTDNNNGDCDASGNVTVVAGQTKTCTITNDDIAPALHLRKVVTNDNGGTATVADFTLTADGAGSNDLSGTSPVDSGAGLSADTFALSESGLTGYSASDYSCVKNGGAPVSGNSVTLGLADTATCTITNNDNAAHLIVIKHVINDNGGSKVAGDFTTTISSVTTATPTAAGVESPGVDNVLTSVGSYSVDEGAHVGYDKTLSADCSGTIALGQTKTCTITNDDQQAYIIVDKTVVNDNGGTASANDFLLTVDGNSVSDGVAYAVNPGTHTAGETLLSGYTQGAWGGDCNTSASVTVALGETKTCTITNNDQQAHITVTKVVNNDHGGTAAPDDFDLTLEGNPATSGVVIDVDPGTYTAGETQLSGYTFDGYSGDCDSNGDTTVALGESKTCTLTNSDIQPKLTLIKHVTNNNGGSKVVSDFPLFVNATSVISGVSNGFDAGSYTASETEQTGYSPSTWSGDCAADGSITLHVGDDKTCEITNDDIAPKLTLVKTVINNNGGTKVVSDFPLFISGTPAVSGTAYDQTANTELTASETNQSGYTAGAWGGDCATDGKITLLPGDNKTCTITNDDQVAHLIVIKHVINDDGGNAVAGDFTMNVTATNPSDDSFAGEEDPGTEITLDAGSYSADESAFAGYSKSLSEGCSGTIAVGETETCTITNDDIQPKLTLVKTVVNDNGGTAVIADFPLFVDTTGVTSGVENGFDAGSYTASETEKAGYDAGDWGGDCAADGSVTLGVGDDKTCTITNDDISPKLTIVKDADPNDCQVFTFGGGLGGFTLDDNNGVQDCLDTDQPQSELFDNILASHSYTVTETLPSLWEFKGVSCIVTGSQTSYNFTPVTNGMSISLNLGDDITCTFNNHKPSPTRTLGFWQTHTSYTSSVFASSPISGSMTIGIPTRKTIDNTAKLFGAFYAPIAKTTTGVKRSQIDQARIQLLQQLVAAKLNCAAFGCQSSVQTMINNADIVYATGTRAQILAAAGQLDVYNNSGDTLIIGNAGNATPKDSKSLADLAFWNTP